MKHFRYIFCFVLFCVEIKAQVNLVPNYSFEQYSSCPNSSVYSLTLSTNWKKATTDGTPDYLNICSNFTGIPLNFEGYQYPRTGNAYCGLFVWAGTTTIGSMEYAQIKLSDSLKLNKQYCVKYFVSRAENEADYAISNFGGYFSDTILNVSTSFNINVIPQIKNPIGNYKMSYNNWEEISGIYTANGGEKYFTIGNFDTRNNTDTIYSPYSSANCRSFCRVYYYIDDVTVEEVANAQAGRDSIINCGDSLVLGADSAIGANYKWTPSIGLNNDSIAFPIANPTITTTYLLRKQQCSIVTYDTVKITVNNNCPINAINELNSKYHFKLYPNPSNENINIEINISSIEQPSISIYNLLGESIKVQYLQNGITNLNISELNSGAYFYSIKVNNLIIKNDKLIITK